MPTSRRIAVIFGTRPEAIKLAPVGIGGPDGGERSRAGTAEAASGVAQGPSGEGARIHRLLPRVVATVIPRPRGLYNDLALPIKLFEYLAYGRPMLVTDCIEQARVVRDADCGLVVGDSVEELAAGITRVVTTSAGELDRWSGNASAAAVRASWAARAERIVEILG